MNLVTDIEDVIHAFAAIRHLVVGVPTIVCPLKERAHAPRAAPAIVHDGVG